MEVTQPMITFNHEYNFRSEIFVLEKGDFLRFTSKRDWNGPAIILRQIGPRINNDVEFEPTDPKFWLWLKGQINSL